MIPQKAIKKFKNDAQREIVAGILLAYGFFPRTSEGIDRAKKFVAGLTEWVAPSDLPNYYNDIESDLMTGRETAGIVNIRMILDEFYFGGAKEESKPEEIPVEIEVVEVEQKTVDEPIVVTIEAPFEPSPETKKQAPKRIRLPRRSGTIPARPIGPPKKSVAERMADAFDERLDDLVDTIQNPPAPKPPRERKKKDSLVKIKKAVKPKSTFKEQKKPKIFENLSAYTGLKIKSAFGRAADARKMAQEQGLPEQKKGFYATRALGFEFGGDRIARTRGTFSKSPDATLDPSLTKQQRYTEGLFGTRTIRSPKRAGGSGDSGSAKDLNNSFDKLTKKFDAVINLKKGTPNSDKEIVEFNKVVEELKDALSKGNKLQKEINESKKEQAKIAADAANAAEAAAKEAAMEEGKSGTGFVDSKALEKQDSGDGGGGPGFNPLDFLKGFKGLRKLFKRFKNPLKTAKALKRLMGQKINKAIAPVKKIIENVTPQVKKITDAAVDLGTKVRGGVVDAAGRATDAVKGGATKVGGWLSGIGDAIKGGARKAWNVASDAASAIGGWIGAKAKAAGDLVASAPGKIGAQLKKFGVPKNWDELATLARSDIGQRGIQLAMGPVGKYVIDQLTNPKSALKIAQAGIANAKVRAAIIKKGGQELLEKILAKLGVKVGGQAVPAIGQVINIGYGVIEAIVRGVMGDLKGSALSLGGAIPWVGAGFSIIDIIRDIDTEAYTAHIEPNLGSIATGDGTPLIGFFNQVAGADIGGELSAPPAEEPTTGEEAPAPKEGETKLSSGGVVPAMVGEAGPEMVMGPGGMNPLQSLAPMIVAMREVTKRAGTWADPIENMVRQTTDPIAKQLNLPVLPMKVDIGQSEVPQMPEDNVKQKKSTGFAGILDAIKKAMGGSKAAAQDAANGYGAASLESGGAAAQAIGSDTAFLSEVTRLSKKYGIKEGDLLGLIASESGFNPAADNGTHVGLIQFSADSARSVGTTQAALKGMSRAEQMKYVEKYFDYWKLPKGASAGQLYAVVFAPAYASKGNDVPLYSSPSAAYRGNAPLDVNNDGHITISELGGRIEGKKKAFGIGGPDTASASSVKSKKDDSGHSAIPIKATPKPQEPTPLTVAPAPPDLPPPAAPANIVSMPGMQQAQDQSVVAHMPSPVPDSGARMEQLRRLRLAQ